MDCKHQRKILSEIQPYTGGEGPHGLATQSLLTVGGITYSQTCKDCGRRRDFYRDSHGRQHSNWYLPEPTTVNRAPLGAQKRRER
jgi:hypothetical protein